MKTLMSAEVVRTHHRKAQGLRAEAYEKNGQGDKAAEIRRTRGD